MKTAMSDVATKQVIRFTLKERKMKRNSFTKKEKKKKRKQR